MVVFAGPLGVFVGSAVSAARDRDHGGVGIGLAIAKALVEAHRGRIAVRSDGKGAGTTFIITLPIGGIDH